MVGLKDDGEKKKNEGIVEKNDEKEGVEKEKEKNDICTLANSLTSFWHHCQGLESPTQFLVTMLINNDQGIKTT